jgi:hypothetical protein
MHALTPGSCPVSLPPLFSPTGNSTGECRTITKPAGVALYSSRCNRTGYLMPNSHINTGSSVQVFTSVGYLPSTCRGLNKECWVYAR